MGLVKEFREFAIKGNFIDLAVGVIIGAAFGAIVTSMVGDIIMPIVGAVTAEEAIKQVKRALGGWQVKGQKETPALPELKLLKKTVNKHHRIPGKSQSDLVIGTNGPRRRDPEPRVRVRRADAGRRIVELGR